MTKKHEDLIKQLQTDTIQIVNTLTLLKDRSGNLSADAIDKCIEELFALNMYYTQYNS
jgi:hypothetical protein